MKMDEKNGIDLPSTEQLKKELDRRNFRQKYISSLTGTFGAILVALAVIVLISEFLFPMYRVSGMTMSPLLSGGEVVLCGKNPDVSKGNVVAFYHSKKVLIKRVIAFSGDVVDITDNGIVSVNGSVIDEPYIEEFSLGECDIEFPYTVPENKYFVLGDNREISVDSRSTAVGCVASEDIIGRVYAVVYPLSDIRVISENGGRNE